MKNVFIVTTFLLGALLVAMGLTKPEPQEHFKAAMGLAQNIVNQEMTSDNVKKAVARAGAEKLAEWGIRDVDAETLEKMGADLDLTGATEAGKDMAMMTVGYYLRSHFSVSDYYVVTVGLLNYKDTNLPMTVGILGKVFVLVDEDQIQQLLRQ
jgi:hypothetical protein